MFYLELKFAFVQFLIIVFHLRHQSILNINCCSFDCLSVISIYMCFSFIFYLYLCFIHSVSNLSFHLIINLKFQIKLNFNFNSCFRFISFFTV